MYVAGMMVIVVGDRAANDGKGSASGKQRTGCDGM